MTTAVLQAHHAVQTLPEVGPEFTQAIVQTDISGPITASDLSTTGLAHTVTDADLPDGENLPPTVDQTSLEAVQSVNGAPLEGHVGLSASFPQSELQLVVPSNLKEGSLTADTRQAHLSDAGTNHSAATAVNLNKTEKAPNENVQSSPATAFTSPPFHGKLFNCVACEAVQALI